MSIHDNDSHHVSRRGKGYALSHRFKPLQISLQKNSDLRDTAEIDMKHTDDCETTFLGSKTPNTSKYVILTCGLSEKVMDEISSFWMTNYEEWHCPLIWLICSGQMFDCLIRHFLRQTRTVICPVSYLHVHRSSTKSASSGLASECQIFRFSVFAWEDDWKDFHCQVKRQDFLWQKFCWMLQGWTFVLTTQIQYVTVSMDAR